MRSLTTWILVGSGPSVVNTLPAVWPQCRPCGVITGNAGIKLVPLPDVYVCCDMVATRRYADAARVAQHNGAHLVTLKRKQVALIERDCEWYDEFLELGRGPATRETWGEFRYTGPLMAEYCCRRLGARDIVLVGCDGYQDGQDEYFDQPDRPAHKVLSSTPEQRTRETLKPGFESVARAFPEVAFHHVGPASWTVDAPNWHAVSEEMSCSGQCA